MALLTTRQAGEFLQLHPTTIRQKVRAHAIPAMRVGGRWRFEESVLREWIARGCPKQVQDPTLFDGPGA